MQVVTVEEVQDLLREGWQKRQRFNDIVSLLKWKDGIKLNRKLAKIAWDSLRLRGSEELKK